MYIFFCLFFFYLLLIALIILRDCGGIVVILCCPGRRLLEVDILCKIAPRSFQTSPTQRLNNSANNQYPFRLFAYNNMSLVIFACPRQ